MTFREFKAWANDRACDGCWGFREATMVLHVIGDVNQQPFWKREKHWNEHWEKAIVQDIVYPVNAKIKELRGIDVFIHLGHMTLKERIERLIDKFL